jgi:hypothetical protein
MNGRQFLRLFPNASRSALEANGALQYAESERHPQATLEPVAEGEAGGAGRITVRFTGFRVRPLDPDNFAGSVKDLLDGLRRADLIPGDEWRQIRLETEQVKIGSKDSERTEIELIYP